MINSEDLYMFDLCDRYIWSHWKEFFEFSEDSEVKECVETE